MKSNDFEMKDSGARQEFETGAVRDLREGKGRYDLVSPFALKRLAIVYEKGAKKYADRNWEKGMPHTRYLDSAIRHLNQYLQGDTDEDHLGHAAWNVFAIMHMQETHPELDDRPNYKPLYEVNPETGEKRIVSMKDEELYKILGVQ